MAMRIPFFGMLSRSPMDGLMEHYEQIAKGMDLIEESMGCIITGAGAGCKEFGVLLEEVGEVEDKADGIKRSIRNHAPRGMFLPVDRTLFFNYTRQQDNILDSALDSLHWISMRTMAIPEEFQVLLIDYVDEISKTIRLLRPALKATIELVVGEPIDREEAKEHYRTVRREHKVVNRLQNSLLPRIFNSDMNFKDIYILIYFVRSMHNMSHNAEGCADMLRAMIAK